MIGDVACPWPPSAILERAFAAVSDDLSHRGSDIFSMPFTGFAAAARGGEQTIDTTPKRQNVAADGRRGTGRWTLKKPSVWRAILSSAVQSAGRGNNGARGEFTFASSISVLK